MNINYKTISKEYGYRNLFAMVLLQAYDDLGSKYSSIVRAAERFFETGEYLLFANALDIDCKSAYEKYIDIMRGSDEP